MSRVCRWGTAALVLLLAGGLAFGWRPNPAGAAAETLLIGQSTWVGYGPLFLARDKRFFDEAGVNVERGPSFDGASGLQVFRRHRRKPSPCCGPRRGAAMRGAARYLTVSHTGMDVMNVVRSGPRDDASSVPGGAAIAPRDNL